MPRPWPAPKPGDPDLIIRDPARLERVANRAIDGNPNARIRFGRHSIAMAATRELHAVWQRYRSAVSKEES